MIILLNTLMIICAICILIAFVISSLSNYTAFILLMVFMGAAIIIKVVLNSYEHPMKYIEVERVDDSKYIQCINGIKTLIIKGGYRTPDSSMALINNSGKPESCVAVEYTESETSLPQNRSKTFVSVTE